MFSKLFRNTLIAVAVTLPMIPLGAGSASAENKRDFTLHNQDELEITQLYVAPASSGYWGPNVLRQDVLGGSSTRIIFNNTSNRYCVYDILAIWADGSKGQVRVNLCTTDSVAFN
ncbi:hypothetical protein K9N68_29175 [Kovacikia minuta CCNUW1]|uniref:hypothetical protein n=1 Tax=Kovacikia minuta TaxID=2931930 RepID=UPI001CC9712B|nr:hypothetical protein [Kovacikia minuta]UBF25598.1 hypothetical protein K9N68_29175 [Kovacikia minuta CCNUW1]